MIGEPLRIAMLSIHSSPMGALGTRETGGMSVYIRELARELGRRGHQVDIFTRRWQPVSSAIKEMHPGVRLIALDGPVPVAASKLALYPHLPAYLHALERFRAVSGLDYHLLHSHYWLSGCLGRWLRKRWRCPHVVMFHSLGEMKNRGGGAPPEPNVRIAAERELAASADLVLAPTAREKDNLIRYCGAAPDRIAVAPCGVDFDRFRPIARATARRHLALDPEAPTMLYVGRFESIKGLDLLVRALALLAPQRRPHLLVVGGDGAKDPEQQTLRREIVALGLAERIHLVGRVNQEQLPLYYSAADFLVVPSRYESFGMVALEALACGCPVVATPVGAMERLLYATQNGVLVTAATPEALARGLETMQNGMPRVAVAAVRSAIQDYAWGRVAEVVLACYRDVTARYAPAAQRPARLCKG